MQTRLTISAHVCCARAMRVLSVCTYFLPARTHYIPFAKPDIPIEALTNKNGHKACTKCSPPSIIGAGEVVLRPPHTLSGSLSSWWGGGEGHLRFPNTHVCRSVCNPSAGRPDTHEGNFFGGVAQALHLASGPLFGGHIASTYCNNLSNDTQLYMPLYLFFHPTVNPVVERHSRSSTC